MLNSFLTYIKEGNRYAGLEVTDNEGVECFYLLELRRKKGEFFITNKRRIETFSELPNDIPLFLIVNSSQVLIKKTEMLDGSSNREGLVNSSFPNLDLSNFYYEIVSQKSSVIVNICKKEYLDTIIAKLKEAKIQVLEFSIGICSIENIWMYVNLSEIDVSNHKITLKENEIEELYRNLEYSNQEYHINGVDVSAPYLLTFSKIIGYLSGNSGISNFEDKINILRNKYWNKRLFFLVMKGSLSLLVLILLLNFFVFNFYFSKTQNLQEEVSSSSFQKERVTQLKQLVDRKQERVETLNASYNSRVTFYLDKLANSVPSSVLLNQITFQPITKSISKSKPIVLEKSIFRVAGISRETNDFSFWIEDLEKKDWIVTVETLEYDYVSKGVSDFLIEIQINEAR